MHQERYPIYEHSELNAVFEFVSVGPKGSIQKAVVFSEMPVRNFYNLGFGDIIPGGPIDKYDDTVRTDNGDMKKVLATVAAILLIFVALNPDAIIFAAGSTEERTRLYRMGITTHLAEIEQVLEIFGLREDDSEWEPFTAGNAYDAFYVQKKK